jgi:hypothetical protein
MGIIINPTDYDDWRWTGSAAAPATNPADLADVNASGVFAWRFTDGETLMFPDQQLPHDYKEGTDIHQHIHWCPSTTATYTGTWTLEYVDWLDAVQGSAIQAKKTITAAFNASLTAYQMQTQLFSDVLAGTNRKISSMVHAKLTLTLSAGTSCFLLGLDGHYQKDRLGSTQPTTK